MSLLVVGFVWLTLCSVSAAQRLDEWNRLRTQVEDLNKKQQAFEMDIQTRLVRVETTLDANSRVVWGIGAAVGLHLLQALAGLVLAARRSPSNPGP